MTCDDGRPCQRWWVLISPFLHTTLTRPSSIKREIGHLCHDERRSKTAEKQSTGTVAAASSSFNGNATFNAASQQTQWGKAPYFYQPETLGNEFSVLTQVRLRC